MQYSRAAASADYAYSLPDAAAASVSIGIVVARRPLTQGSAQIGTVQASNSTILEAQRASEAKMTTECVTRDKLLCIPKQGPSRAISAKTGKEGDQNSAKQSRGDFGGGTGGAGLGRGGYSHAEDTEHRD